MSISIKNLSKSFGNTSIMDDVTVSVEAGEFCAIVGPSGSGKTSLLKMIAGIDTDFSGNIQIAGKNLDEFNYPPAVLIWQDQNLFDHLSVAENIAFGLHARKLQKHDIKDKVHYWLEKLNISRHEKKYPSQISGGERQRVAIARSMIVDAPVVLFDEPFTGLDVHLFSEFKEVLVDIIADREKTFLLVTHNYEEVLGLSNRVIVLYRGKIIQDGSAEEIIHNPVNEYVAKFAKQRNIIDAEVLQKKDSTYTIKSALGTFEVKGNGRPLSSNTCSLVVPMFDFEVKSLDSNSGVSDGFSRMRLISKTLNLNNVHCTFDFNRQIKIGCILDTDKGLSLKVGKDYQVKLHLERAFVVDSY